VSSALGRNSMDEMRQQRTKIGNGSFCNCCGTSVARAARWGDGRTWRKQQLLPRPPRQPRGSSPMKKETLPVIVDWEPCSRPYQWAQDLYKRKTFHCPHNSFQDDNEIESGLVKLAQNPHLLTLWTPQIWRDLEAPHNVGIWACFQMARLQAPRLISDERSLTRSMARYPENGGTRQINSGGTLGAPARNSDCIWHLTVATRRGGQVIFHLILAWDAR